MKVLVTGADGFVGSHLLPALARASHQVVSAGGPNAPEPFVRLDVTSPERVEQLIKSTLPDAVIHLAGQSSVAQSHQNPAQAYNVNTLGTANVLTALRALAPSARTLLISSGEVYGASASEAPLEESAPLIPTSPYAASKVAAEIVARQFQRGYGQAVVIARPFNHLGRGQNPNFVVPSFAAQIERIRRNEIPPLIRTGNLDAARDFSHVDDVVEAYVLLLEKGVPGESYNVSSGVARTVESILGELLELSGVTAKVELDPSRLRPTEIPVLKGSPAKLLALGWKPTRNVRQALQDVLDEMKSKSPQS